MKRMTLWASVGAGVVAVNAVVWIVVHDRVNSGAVASGGGVVAAQAAEDRLGKLEAQMGAVAERVEGFVEALARYESRKEASKQEGAHVSEIAKESESPRQSTTEPRTSGEAGVTPGATSGRPVDDQVQFEQRRVAQLDNAIASDDVDTRSGQAAEMAIQGIFSSGESFATQLVSAECRVSLCKFVVTAKTMQEAQDFAMTFPGRLGWASDSEVRMSAPDSVTGAVELTIFQSRDGQRLPTPNG